MTKPFDPTKPVQTRDGRPARILATDLGGNLPIAVAVKVGTTNSEMVGQRSLDGRCAGGSPRPADLINTPEVTKEYRRVWTGLGARISKIQSLSEELCRAGADPHRKYLGILVIEKTDGEISDTYFIPWEKKE